MGLQEKDHAGFAIGRDRNAESPEHERRGGHMADTAHLELFPLAPLGTAVQFHENFPAEFDEDDGYRVGRQIRPQAMHIAE